MFVGLMENWRQVKNGKTVVRISRLKKRVKFPATVSFAVLGSDWPGLSESCIGVLHQKGYNIAFAKGMVVKHGEQQLGVVIMAVEVNSREELDRLTADKKYLVETLSKSSIGSLAKAYLIAREGRRLEAEPEETVRLEKDDGSFVEGRGFTADFRRKRIEFSSQVRGSYVWEEEEEEEQEP